MKKEYGQKTINHIIILLIVLLAFSGTVLAGVFLSKAARQMQTDPAVSPNNVITPEKETSVSMAGTEIDVSANTSTIQTSAIKATMGMRTVSAATVVDQDAGEETILKIYRNHAEDSSPFRAGNLFPGDAETRSYYLEVSYKSSVTLHFHADIRSGYEKLAEVLKCRVELRDGAVLYDGLMKDMPESIPYTLPQSSQEAAEIVYDITVSLDTSAGNEYMEKELLADFRWWAYEDGHSDAGDSDAGTSDKPTGTDPSGKTDTDRGELLPVKTGDESNVLFYGIVVGISLLVLILFFVWRHRKKEDKERGK